MKTTVMYSVLGVIKREDTAIFQATWLILHLQSLKTHLNPFFHFLRSFHQKHVAFHKQNNIWMSDGPSVHCQQCHQTTQPHKDMYLEVAFAFSFDRRKLKQSDPNFLFFSHFYQVFRDEGLKIWLEKNSSARIQWESKFHTRIVLHCIRSDVAPILIYVHP